MALRFWRKWKLQTLVLLISLLCIYLIFTTHVAKFASKTGKDTNINGGLREDKFVIPLGAEQASGSLRSLVEVQPEDFKKHHGTLEGTSVCKISLEQFRQGNRTGNPLIDDYGLPGHELTLGGMGRGVVASQTEQHKVEDIMKEFSLNTLISDVIPLNRVVPDSRINGCARLSYPSSLPQASIIMPFYNEWQSVLLRTVYSIINRSPRHLLHQIVLVDDGSSLAQLKEPLDEYINGNFPKGLISLIRMPQRKGLIAARMRGVTVATGEVIIFLDSHMEVNINWLEPLLYEVSKDQKTVAMATLDYIENDTFMYKYNENYLTRYGWSWSLIFFETFFREDQIGPKTTDPRPGPSMVGAAFATDRLYFNHLGGYDPYMSVWGGENLEMSWRVWLCGGRLLHVPCSRIGHIARFQPYEFPGGRENIVDFNHERAVRVWMGNYSRYVHITNPHMETLDIGDISERVAIKSQLKCKDFGWYLHNIWPELNIFEENARLWGKVVNKATSLCLDNDNYLFQAEAPVYLRQCSNRLDMQGFSLTQFGHLRTTLQCLSRPAVDTEAELVVVLRDCIIERADTWNYSQDEHLVHLESGRCLDIGDKGPVVTDCDSESATQQWNFAKIT